MSEDARRELVARAGQTPTTRAGLRSLTRALEGEDLPALFERARGDLDAETHIALVAALRGEPLPLELLRDLVPDVEDFGALIILLGRSQERKALLEALVEAPWTTLEHRACAVALYLHDYDFPAAPNPLVMELRQMLRSELPSLWHDELILATARRLRDEDEHVATLYERATGKLPELHPEAIALPGRLSKQVAEAGLDELPEHQAREPRGAPAAAPKVGRNDPCPCGSGKKLKKCCGAPGARPTERADDAAEHQRRLRPDRYLSLAELREGPPARLARLPFAELDEEVHAAAMMALMIARHLPGIRAALDAWVGRGVQDEARNDAPILDTLMVLVSHLGAPGQLPRDRPEASSADLQRWVAAIRDPEARASARQMVAAGAPRDADDWALLEAAFRAGLEDPRTPLLDVAAPLVSSYPALASYLMRGLALEAHPEDGHTAAAYVALARDLLGAPPDDPLPAVLRLLDRDDAHADAREAQVAEAQRAQEALEEQLAELRAAMRSARARNERLALELEAGREALAALEAADADVDAPAVDPVELRRLRGKVRELKGRIEEGNRERSELRERARRAKESGEAAGGSPASEPGPTEGERGSASQPPVEELSEPTRLRVPEWSARARKSLGALPAAIAQQAVVLAAQLATGDPLARRGAKKLEGFEHLRRARLGIHYRLLYVLQEETLEVVDVLARENLDSHLGRYRKTIG